MLQRVRRALDEDLFVVFAEPIVALGDREPHTHELTLRLPAEAGQLEPSRGFHQVAGRFGLLAELDDLLIRRAAALARDGRRVAVDIHGASLGDPDLARRTEQALADAHVDPQLMTFEIAEEALAASAPAASAFVQRLHDLGCHVTGDHFGAGASGFGYLKRISIDLLKLDAGFVSDLGSTRSDEQLVRAFVHLAQGLQIGTAADGVLDEARCRLLEDTGVQHGQGPFLGPCAEVPPGGLGAIAARHAASGER